MLLSNSRHVIIASRWALTAASAAHVQREDMPRPVFAYIAGPACVKVPSLTADVVPTYIRASDLLWIRAGSCR